MSQTIKKFEAFFMKEFTEKAGRIAVFSLLFMIPQFEAKLFFLFLFVVFGLASDIHNKKFSTLISLPFSYKDVYLMSYTFIVTVVTLTSLAGAAIFSGSIEYGLMNLFSSLIFVTAYYGISILSVTFGMDNFGIPFLVFIIDMIVSNIGNRYTNPFFAFSPTTQGVKWLALLVAVLIFATGFYVFDKKGVQK
ncbi:MAG: hypothetical protein ACQESN_11710 [Thermotogota bacterium]